MKVLFEILFHNAMASSIINHHIFNDEPLLYHIDYVAEHINCIHVRIYIFAHIYTYIYCV